MRHRLRPVPLYVWTKRRHGMKYRVVGGSLNVRQKPSTDSPVNHILSDGEIIEAGENVDGWCAHGSGYVMARWLEPVPEEPPVPEETAEAKEIKKAAKEIKTAAEEISDVTKEIKAAKKATARKTSAKKTGK